MDLRELVAYTFILLAVALAIGGIWAARYYSPGRRYARLRAKERREAREREKLRKASTGTAADNA